MLQSFVSACLILFTYCLAPLAVSLVAAGKLTDKEAENQWAVFLSCLGLGPLIIAWSLEIFLRAVPGLSDAAYTAMIVALFLPVFYLAFKCRSVIPLIFRQAQAQLVASKKELVISGLLVFGAFWNFLSAFRIAMRSYFTGNDALEYGRMAQLIYEHKSLDIYPFFGGNGINEVFGSAHPLGYHLSILWGFMVNGSSDFFGYARLINPFFGICTAALLWGAFSGRRVIYGALAIFFLSMSPQYMDLVWNKHIDVIRTYGYCLAIAGAWLFVTKPSNRSAAILGLGIGASLYTHALGVLTPVVIGGVFLAQMRPTVLFRQWRQLAFAGFLALAIGGSQYVRNTLEFGAPTVNSTQVLNLQQVEYGESLTVLRNLRTTEQKLTNGLLSTFTNPDKYAYLFWTLPAGLLLLAFRRLDDAWSKTCLYACLSFFGIMTLSMVAGSITLIMNGRYVLGLQPLAASVAAFCLGKYYERYINFA